MADLSGRAEEGIPNIKALEKQAVHLGQFLEDKGSFSPVVLYQNKKNRLRELVTVICNIQRY